MKQYRFTAADFVPQGETGSDDAVMDAQDLARIRRLAGLVTEDFYSAGVHDPALTTPNDSNANGMSPVGNPGNPAMNKRKIEKEQNIRPGSPEWFRLWCAKPYLTGEKPIGDEPAPQVDKKQDAAFKDVEQAEEVIQNINRHNT